MNLSDLDIVIDRKNTNSMKFDFAKEEGKPENLLPFWIADMDFPVAACITEALQKRVDHAIYGYSEAKPSYFKAVHDWFLHNFQWDTKPEWLVKTPGVVPAINLAVKALTKENEAVLIHRPVYHPFTFAIENNKRKLVNSPLILKNGRYEIDFADMERKITENKVKLAIFCSPHNPTGRVWERWEIEKAMEIYAANDCLVISDEIWSDIIMPGHKHIPTQSVSRDARARTMAFYAPSKTFSLAGLVGSFHIIYDPLLRDRVRRQGAISRYNECNVLSMHALQAAFSPEGEEWVEQMCRAVDENMGYACAFIEENISGVKVMRPQGTYMLFLDCGDWCREHGVSIHELQRRGVKAGVIWQNGEDFICPDSIRMNLALPLSQLREAMERLEKYAFV